jgi:hypothetical protein
LSYLWWGIFVCVGITRVWRATLYKHNNTLYIMRPPPKITTPTYVLNREQSNLIWRLSWLCTLTAAFAAHRQYYDFAIATTCVFLTSILYWHAPDYSYRRYLDMLCVFLGMSYQYYAALYTTTGHYYIVYNSLGIVSYIIGVEYYKRGQCWTSTYCHCGIHIMGNIANIMLYSGERCETICCMGAAAMS